MVEIHTFSILPSHHAGVGNAAIRRPREITYFSFDDDHRFRLDASSLRYFYRPTLPADLNQGFETFRQLDDSKDDHLDGLVDAVAAHEANKGLKLDVDILTWRGMMTKIMTAPYANFDEWEMNATLFQGTIFIEENRDKKLESREKQNQAGAHRGQMSQDLMSFWGYKFETLSLLPKTWSETPREYIESRETEVVSNYAQYCSIVRTGFGSTKLIIGGEVDAVEAYKPEDSKEPINWIELKTTAEISNDRDIVKFERKLLKFWAQSFLLGVPKVIVGYRSSQGMLERLEEIDTQTIPDRVLRGRRTWTQMCINITSDFLAWLKTIITSEGTWRIRKRERSPDLEVFKVEETGTGDILSEAFLRWRTLGQLSMPSTELELAANPIANGHNSTGNGEVTDRPEETRPEASPLSDIG
ncbi:Decapping nuclease rai1 [Cyphellophora attinorum]|uniref:Decapping nuclease n=1 Tax=Cyphellophora attinorum TaxID=1664694 RepID=A0A0N1P020_9EURO|nr:Decapping nuclease rai1 [Phialophora attinorum]KPI42515.1 Decapping nuclease rai1 [Phialophora attinorum]